MNKEKFDNYSFSINTEIKVDGAWEKVIDVNFVDREVNGYPIQDIQDIKN